MTTNLPALLKLQKLELNGNDLKLDLGAIANLAAALPALTALTSLDLSEKYTNPAAGAALVTSLAVLPKLALLNLASNDGGDYSGLPDWPRGAPTPAHALKALTGLTDLNMPYNNLGERETEALAPVLASFPGLQLSGRPKGSWPLHWRRSRGCGN